MRTAPAPNVPPLPGMCPGIAAAGGGGGSGDGDGDGSGGKGKGGKGKGGKGNDASGGGNGSGGCGDPVCPITGKVFLEFLDFTFPAPHALRWLRHYSSRLSVQRTELGYGWSHAYGWWLEEHRREIAIFDEKAREQRFVRPRTENFVERNSLGWVLTRAGDEHTLWLPDGRTLTFERLGSTRRQFLSKVADHHGNAIHIARDEEGRLTQLVDSVGRVYRVETDREGRIVEIAIATDPEGAQHMVVARYAYDEAGDLVSFEDAEGYVWRYRYEEHLLVEHRTPNDLSYFYRYDGGTSKAYCVETWGEYASKDDPALEHPVPRRPAEGRDTRKVKGIQHVRFTYDKNDYYTETENGLGGVTRYFGDALGRIVKQVNPDGGVFQRSFDDGHGGIVSEVRPDQTVLEGSFDADGTPTGFRAPDGKASHTEPLGPLDEIVGNETTGSLYHRQYDPRGNLIFVRHADGTTEEYRYEPRGMLASVIDRWGELTRYEHDAMANCVRVVLPGGAVETNEYDYLGRRLAHVDCEGRRTEWRYDRRNEIVWKQHADGTEIHVTRDAERMPISATEGGRSYRFEWGGIRWITKVTTPSGGVTEYKYDVEGNLRLVKNARGQEFRQEFDVASRLIRTRTFEGLAYEYEYKLGQGPRKIFQPDGEYAFERDLLGNVTAMEGPHDLSIAFDIGPQSYEVDNGVAPIEQLRDDERRVYVEKQGGHETRVRWSVTMPTLIKSDVGVPIEQQLGRSGRPNLIIAGQNHIEVDRPVAGVDGFDHLTMLGDHLVMRRHFNVTGQLAYQSVAQRSLKIADEIAGTSADPGLLLWRRYEYDQDHALRVEYRSDGTTVQYGTTADGQVESRTVYRGGKVVEEERVRFDPAGTPLVAGARYDAAMRPVEYQGETFAYDDAGRLIERVTDAGTWTYTWGALDALVEVKRPDGAVVQMEYDALGRRVKKRVLRAGGELAKSISYVWENKVVLHEHDDLQSKTRTFVRLPYAWEPIVFVDSSVAGEQFYVHVNDPIGGIDTVLDEQGRVVVEGLRTIYGRFEPAVAEVDVHTRFANQFWDADVELVYNFKRWYDPRVGLYVSPDPILLDGSLNPRDYAPNPLKYVDPLGLAWLTPNPSGGTNPATPAYGHPDRPAHPAGGNPNNYDANYLSQPGYNATNGRPGGPPGYASADPTNPASRSFGSSNNPNSARSIVDNAGNTYGCHSCGRTKSQVQTEDGKFNHWVPDHQPPVSCMQQYKNKHGTFPPGECRLYPHCPRCSSRQKNVLSQMSNTTSKPALQQQMRDQGQQQMQTNQLATAWNNFDGASAYGHYGPFGGDG